MTNPNAALPLPAFIDGKPKGMLIDGNWVQSLSGETIATINPCNGAVLAEIASGNREDVDLAVAAARRAFEGPWNKVKPVERQNLLLRLADLVDQHFDELSLLDSLDMGIPISRVKNNRARAVGMLRYYAGQAVCQRGETIENSVAGDFLSHAVKEPVGVVAAIIAWNSPLTAAILKLGPVIAAGCTIVIKPSEIAPLSPLRLAELCQVAGFPDGVINVVTGYGHTAGQALADHMDVDKLAFTGSTATGQKLIQASAGNIKRLALELGGKSANIVFSDADLDAAVPAAAMAVFGNTGQSCGAGSRLLVERKIYNEFVERVAAFGKTLKVGNSLDPETVMGPLVSQVQLDRVLGYMNSAVAEGADLVSGGSRLTEGALSSGYFVPPTVFGQAREDMRIVREEIFGPVIAAIPFDTPEEAIAIANRTSYGLGGGVWSRDIGKALKVGRAVRTGQLWINCYSVLDPAVPHGGIKMSGFGREQGPTHVEEFLYTKSLWIKVG